MDTDFLIYQKRQELWQLAYSDWLSSLTTIKFWAMIAFILVAYMIWYKLTDKKRLVDLLLFGSFIAVMRVIVDAFGEQAGFWYYKEHTIPTSPSMFIHVLTLTPLTFMLVQQRSSNWRQFFIWAAVGAGFLHFLTIPVLGKLNYVQLMRWNNLYAFVTTYSIATLSRAAFHLVVQVQEKAREGKVSPLQSTLMQPAFKPLQDKEADGDEDTK